VNLLFAVGGDGTALRALHLAAPHDVPVLAINLGRLGYLADVDASQLDAALEALTRGRYTMELWRALEVSAGEPVEIESSPRVLGSRSRSMGRNVEKQGQAIDSALEHLRSRHVESVSGRSPSRHRYGRSSASPMPAS
jgi:ATP-NAD kinase N-terminal domain